MTSGKGVDDRINTLIKKKEELFNYGQDIVMAFSPPVVGCLVKNGLEKGGSREPLDPPGRPMVLPGMETLGAGPTSLLFVSN